MCLFKAKFNIFCIILTVAIMFQACSSTTIIKSIPAGAKVYILDEYKGTTPYVHTDQKIVGSKIPIKLKLDGYKDFHTVLIKDEKFQFGACCGGIIFLFPFIWIMGYNPEHTYELEEFSQE
ncbi:MAG: PEGA domain-containing protein [Spirochaetota bacterium]|nr:PEGA domain-containing protein [Spirochaetota bacterium]